MKVIKNNKNQKSLLYMKNPPLEVKTGLLPQDMLVPSGLYIPDNIKGIMGNLEIPTIEDNGLKIEVKSYKTEKKQNKNVSVFDALKEKVFYVSTCQNKDILVFNSSSANPDYALEQNGVVYDFQATPDNKFLLVTNYNKTILDVISLADDMKIKQVDLTTDGGEILVDKKRNKAYISSPKASLLYVLDINTMTLTQKIKLKGKCMKFVLTDNNNKIFYYDQKTKEVWSVELDNDYVTKYVGSFPNISKIEYANGKVYLLSRVAGRLAAVDYTTLNLMTEKPVKEKPVDMLVYKNYLYVLSAYDNVVQILDTFKDEIVGEIPLGTKGFSTKIFRINNTKYALITDALANKYSIIDLDGNTFVRNTEINSPVSKMIVLPKIRKN